MSTIRTAIELEDCFTGVLNNVINSVNLSLSAMEDLQKTMSADVDTSSFEAARNAINQATVSLLQLNEAAQSVEAPKISQPAVSANIPQVQEFEWQSFDGLEVFKTTGAERYEQEVANVNSMLQELCSTQYRITQAANESEILSPQAQYDVSLLENRISSLYQQIRQIEENPLNIGSDSANASLEQLRERLSQTVQLQENLNSAMESGDISGLNSAYIQLSQTISSTEKMVRDSFENIPPVEIPVHWQSDGIEVFNSTGVERFKQEVQSANAMLNTLNTTQQRIASTAASTNLLPANAVADMNAMQSRLQAIQRRIQTIQSNRLNMVSPTANAELERLRTQLNQAVQAQEALNDAVANMDAGSANQAYLQLSQRVRQTEQYLRDNVNEQGRFNQEVREGASQSGGLMSAVKKIAGAYAGIQGAKKLVEMSDSLVTAKSRLDMMNDGLQSTDELYSMIYGASQRARGSLDGMTDVVARFGNNAKDAFSSNEEVVAFSELIQKQMTIAGASTQEAANAELQLSQALGSGVLRGDELNSIFEQAPNLIQGIADYLHVPIGQIREMASEGQLTADVVKASVFASADEINKKFESMPMTWGQLWQQMQNQAVMTLNPLLERINGLINTETFQTATQAIMDAFSVLASVALNVLNVVAGAISWVAGNWESLAPIILGVAAALAVYGASLVAAKVKAIAAAVAQNMHNIALGACPVTWIVIAIITLIAAIYSVCQSIAKFTGIANSGFGVICGGVMVVIAFFKNLGLAVANIALGIWEAMCACGENIWAVFHNVFCDLQWLWYGFLKVVMDVVKGVCDVLNFIPFVNIDTSGLESASRDYANKQAEAQNNKTAYKDVGEAFNKGASTFDAFSDGWVEDAFQSGAAWGDGVVDGINSMLDGFSTDINTENYESTYSNVGGDVSAIAENTADIKDGLDVTEEEIKYLRDIAEQEAINRFTTAEIHIEQNNHNNISSDMDLDGFVTGLTDAVNEAAEMISEGVHA